MDLPPDIIRVNIERRTAPMTEREGYEYIERKTEPMVEKGNERKREIEGKNI